MIKKLLACVIIFLFIGMNIVSSTNVSVMKKSIITMSRGNILYVGGSGPGNYTKIQDAINDANDGDTVFVYNGTYKEAVDVDKSINLIGEDRDITKIINKYEDLYAVDISADFVNISGFTIITNCFNERYDIGLISIVSCNNNVSNNILKGDYSGTNGIELSGSSNNNTIIGNIILYNSWGIYLSSSSNNIIKNNNLSHNLDDIILKENCMNNTITGNTLLDTNWCYSISIQSSSNNTIIDNTFSNIWGSGCIELYSSNKNVVMNNTMISVPSGHGITIRHSKENIIIGNTIKNLEWVSAIYLGSATDNTITSNNLICCNTTGIRSYKKYASNDNSIHHNNFYNNTQNAYDECNNEWDNGYPSGGNYWDDYNGTDADGDGIGDTPYPIPGGDNQDRYPLMEPWEDNLLPIAEFNWKPLHPNPGEKIFFNASKSIDYDGYIKRYKWDWDNDGEYDETHGTPNADHTFDEIGYYPVTLIIYDNESEIDTITKTVRVGNLPPDEPIITGPKYGKVGVEYQYNFSLSDPDDDAMYLRVDWGNGTPGPWQGPYNSGKTVRLNHTWNEKGTYIIGAQAKDIYDAESDWGYLEVEMPVNYQNSQKSSNFFPTNKDILDDTSASSCIKDAVDISKGLPACDHLAYLGAYLDYFSLYEFILNDPGNLTEICNNCDNGNPNQNFLSGATWTNDQRFLGCEYSMGTLYEIDIETCEITTIGGGGTGLNGLAYDPTDEVLYGCSSDGLYKIDPEDGSQEYIGNFGISSTIIAIACDANGSLYGWDVKFSGDSYLYEIDTETGEATVVGSLGMTLCYAQDGDFCKRCDILYLAAYVTSPVEGSYLYECDEDTGNCTLIGEFENNVEASILVIPYNLPPVTNISFNPPEPDGCNDYYVSNVTVTLNATDNTGVNATYYRINGEEWQIYNKPFVLSEDGNDVLIEFYSVDIEGNTEDVKSSIISIDKTPPETSLEWETFKKSLKWYVRFILNATDETSGMCPYVAFYLNDILQGEFEVLYWPFELIMLWSKAFKSYCFKFECSDMAGHTIFESVNGSDIESYPSSQSISQQPHSVYGDKKSMNFFPTNKDILDDNFASSYVQHSVNRSKGLLSNGHIAYFLGSYENCSGLFEFELPDRTNFTLICGVSSFSTGGTWTHRYDGVIFGIDMYGNLWKLDPETCEVTMIGSSGTAELFDLSYDPYNDILYGISSNRLYSINMTTGEATLVGSMGNPGLMRSIDCDYFGNLYGIELNLSNCKFYSINTSTGHATFIGNTSFSVDYASNLAFDKYDEIMYACIFNYETKLSELYTINISTGYGTFVDIFPPDGNQISMLTIPYNWTNQPPEPPIIDGPKNGKIGIDYIYTFTLNDPDDDYLFIKVDWDDDTPVFWDGPYGPGNLVTLNHTWNEQGTYIIRAKLRDPCGAESDWGALEVTMPKNQVITQNTNLFQMFERFTNRFPLLEQLFNIQQLT